MAKGLGVNKESKQKASKALVDGNVGWAPSVGQTKKIPSKLSIGATPPLKN